MFFGGEGEGVYVYTIGGGVGEALVGLDVVEVVTVTLVESVVTVELEETKLNRVFGSVDLETVVIVLVYYDIGGGGTVTRCITDGGTRAGGIGFEQVGGLRYYFNGEESASDGYVVDVEQVVFYDDGFGGSEVAQIGGVQGGVTVDEVKTGL